PICRTGNEIRDHHRWWRIGDYDIIGSSQRVGSASADGGQGDGVTTGVCVGVGGIEHGARVSVTKIPTVISGPAAQIGEQNRQWRYTAGWTRNEIRNHRRRWRIGQREADRKIVHSHGIIRPRIVHISPPQVKYLAVRDARRWRIE